MFLLYITLLLLIIIIQNHNILFIDASYFDVGDEWSCNSGACPDRGNGMESSGGNVTIKVVKAINLADTDGWGPFGAESDPYIKVRVGGKTGKAITVTGDKIVSDLNPQWNETIHIGTLRSKTQMTISVMDSDSGFELFDDTMYEFGLKVPFCAFMHAKEETIPCDLEYGTCSAVGDAWAAPTRLICKERNWVNLDGGNPNRCETTTDACLYIETHIIPFQFNVVQYYGLSDVEMGMSVAGYDAKMAEGDNWPDDWSISFGEYGALYTDNLASVFDPGYSFGKALGGAAILRTHENDGTTFSENELYARISMNLKGTLYICRYQTDDKKDTLNWLTKYYEKASPKVLATGDTIPYDCYKREQESISMNQYDDLIERPIYLWGNVPGKASATPIHNYIVLALPYYDNDGALPYIWSVDFDRDAFWDTLSFMFIQAVFYSWAWTYVKSINFRIDRVESYILQNVNKADKNILSALFATYNLTRHNIIFRRNLFWCKMGIYFSLMTPLFITWTWGIILMKDVNPPALGFAVCFLGTMGVLGAFGFKLWQSRGYCMNSITLSCFTLSITCGLIFLVMSIYADPQVYLGNADVNFPALSVVCGTLNMLPLIFLLFSNDKTTARSVKRLQANIGVAAKASRLKGTAQMASAKGKAAVEAEKAKMFLVKGNFANAKAGPLNVMFGDYYTINQGIPGFKMADMFAIVLARASSADAKRKKKLYYSSVLCLALYLILVYNKSNEYFGVAVVNVGSVLLLDFTHYLLARGGGGWSPGKCVGIMSTGRMLIMAFTGDYWMAGLSFAYMLYGYFLIKDIIKKYLPHITAQQAGAVAFFGHDLNRETSNDMANSTECQLGVLSFCFIFLMLVCAYKQPASLPLPDIEVIGQFWPVYIFGVGAFLIVLCSGLIFATLRATMLEKDNLLKGAFRHAYFVREWIRVHIILGAISHIAIMCSGLLIYAATKSSAVFIITIFLPVIVLLGSASHSTWTKNDFVLVKWPPAPEVIVPEDETLDDGDVALGMIGNLFGVGSPAGKGHGDAFSFNMGPGGDLANAKKSDTNNTKFQLPPLESTGKEVNGEIKMPALPLRAQKRKKDGEEDDDGDDEVLGLTNNFSKDDYEVDGETKDEPGEKSANFDTGPPKTTKRSPRIINAIKDSYLVFLLKIAFKVLILTFKCFRKVFVFIELKKNKKKKLQMELGEGEGEGEEEEDEEEQNNEIVTKGSIKIETMSFTRAFLEGYLYDNEYAAIFTFWAFLFSLFLTGSIISAAEYPYWLGNCLWSFSFIFIFTYIPMKKYFNTLIIDMQMKLCLIFAGILLFLTCVIFFAAVSESNVQNESTLWIFNILIFYPVTSYMIFKVLKWKDNGWEITNLDEDGDGKFSMAEVMQFFGITPVFFFLCIILLIEISYWGTSLLSILSVLLFISGFIFFVFLRDWAKNDFYLSPLYRKVGGIMVSVGMYCCLFSALFFEVNLIVCISIYFMLDMFEDLSIVFGRAFVIDPEAPIFYSPYIFPIFSYDSRISQLIDETENGIHFFKAITNGLSWGLFFCVFIQPLNVGVTLACTCLLMSIGFVAVLIEQVPLSLGQASRFVDGHALIDAADAAKALFDDRRRDVDFECLNWKHRYYDDEVLNPVKEAETAGDLAASLHQKMWSLRKVKITGSAFTSGEGIHTDAIFSVWDAVRESFLAGRGPFGIFGLFGGWYKLLNFIDRNRKLPTIKFIKKYDKDGQPKALGKLSGLFDSQAILVSLPVIEENLNKIFFEELRCAIHFQLLIMVAADSRLRREKVLFQKFLRENRFKLLSNGIAPPKNIFNSESYASIDIALVAVWLSTLTSEERERFHLLKAKFTDEQTKRDRMVDKMNLETKMEGERLIENNQKRCDEMCKKAYQEIKKRRERRLRDWEDNLHEDDSNKWRKLKFDWLEMMEGRDVEIFDQDKDLYERFSTGVLLKGEDEALIAGRDKVREIESGEIHCKPGKFGRVFQYYDAEFPASDTSIGPEVVPNLSEVGWKVAPAINENATLFGDGTDPDDIFRGKLSNEWLLSAISMLAAAGGVGDGDVDEQIQNLFVGYLDAEGQVVYSTEVGVYGVRLYKNGQWENVIIDDLFPIEATEQENAATKGAAFAYSKGYSELWVPALEKAFAKYYGSYEAISEGYVHHALTELTGCEAEEIFLAKAGRGIGKQALWSNVKQYKKNGYILGAGSISKGLADREILDTGLVFGASYTIYDIVEVDGHCLLRLRNPPGDHEEWRGDWGDNSPCWNKRIKGKLGYTNEDDNTFWMSFDDFCLAFNSLYVCRWYDPHKWYSTQFHGRWQLPPAALETDEGGTAPGLPCQRNPTCILEDNPQYLITAHRPTEIKITLTQADMGGLSSPETHPIAMYLLNQSESHRSARINKITRMNLVTSTGRPEKQRTISIYTTVVPGDYVLLCGTYMPGMEGPFSIQVMSNYELGFEQLWPIDLNSATNKMMAAVKKKVKESEKKLLGDTDDMKVEDIEDIKRQAEDEDNFE